MDICSPQSLETLFHLERKLPLPTFQPLAAAKNIRKTRGQFDLPFKQASLGAGWPSIGSYFFFVRFTYLSSVFVGDRSSWKKYIMFSGCFVQQVHSQQGSLYNPNQCIVLRGNPSKYYHQSVYSVWNFPPKWVAIHDPCSNKCFFVAFSPPSRQQYANHGPCCEASRTNQDHAPQEWPQGWWFFLVTGINLWLEQWKKRPVLLLRGFVGDEIRAWITTPWPKLLYNALLRYILYTCPNLW